MAKKSCLVIVRHSNHTKSGSMSRSFVYLMPSFSSSPIPVSPSESVTKSPPLCYYTPSPLLLKVLPRVTKSPPYVTKSHACLRVTLSFITINLSTCLLVNLSTYSLTLSPSYPVIPLSPVTHRTCSSVTLSFIAPRVFPCLLVDLSSALQSTICSHYVIMSFYLNMSLCHSV